MSRPGPEAGGGAVGVPYFVVPSSELARDPVVVSGAQGRHGAAVRRLRPGEPVVVTDGLGALARGTVAGLAGRDGFAVQVDGRERLPAPVPRVAVVQALPKGDRGERAVELMTEAGVDLVVPWQAERCVARWDADRKDRHVRRWQRVATEAAKQSRRGWHPRVGDLAALPQVLALVREAATAVVLHEAASGRIAAVSAPVAGDLVLIVGPEGGLTGAEVSALRAAGASAVRLGPEVVRTSTAGAVAAAVLLAGTSRWA